MQGKMLCVCVCVGRGAGSNLGTPFRVRITAEGRPRRCVACAAVALWKGLSLAEHSALSVLKLLIICKLGAGSLFHTGSCSLCGGPDPVQCGFEPQNLETESGWRSRVSDCGHSSSADGGHHVWVPRQALPGHYLSHSLR